MSLLDDLALRALEAEEVTLEDQKHELHWQQAAYDVVRRSPLQGWFPISWVLVDHDLHVTRPQGDRETVVVQPQDEEGYTRPVPLRLIVTAPTPNAPLWDLAIAAPDATEVDWRAGATTILSAAGVGRWIRSHQ